MKEFRLLMVSGHILLGMVHLDVSISKILWSRLVKYSLNIILQFEPELRLNHLMTSDSPRN